MERTQKYLSLLFHEVLEDVDNSGFQRASAKPYKHDLTLFSSYLDVIAKSKRNIGFNTQQSLTSNYPLLLTFDDGGKSNILSSRLIEKIGCRGIFFISTAYLNSDYFLSNEDVKQLHERGHIIGAHSHTHPNIFRNLSYSQMLEEWATSKKILEGIIGEEVLHCSIPGGDASDEVYRSASESGFTLLFDSEPITERRFIEGISVFGRFCPKRDTSVKVVSKWLAFKGLSIELRKRQAKNFIKKSLAPLYTFKRSFDKHYD